MLCVSGERGIRTVVFLLYIVASNLLSIGSDEESNVQEAIQQSLEYHREETQRRF